MPLEPGMDIAHYRVLSMLGAGGMGEVYRASDTKLGRDVALKLLPAALSSDPERMARFQREAQVLATLNHPNIATIYGVEESDGHWVLVLELVEGQDLAERLRTGPLAVDDAVEISRQIAEALEAAHDRGVVHRDLKPANVKVTPAGEVKVLDFGLAKALEHDPLSSDRGDPIPSLSPTLTAQATRAGIILGTAAYMSPEQAKGKSVDRRADIFSFGVVLLELLSGRRCFRGETVSETLAAVIKDAPPWETLPAETPRAIRLLLQRCLDKDPRERLRDIGEARILLQKLARGETAAAVGLDPGGESVVDGKRPARMAPWIALVVLASAAAGLAAGWLWNDSEHPPPTPRRLAIDHDDLWMGYGTAPVLSPDGARIAYIAENKLWIRDLTSLVPREVDSPARAPFWSHDGGRLAWATRKGLKVVDATGGQPAVLAELHARHITGGTWAEDGTIYLVPRSGPIYRLAPQGGEVLSFLEPRPEIEQDFHTPHALPGNRGLLYSVHRTDTYDTIEVLPREGARRVVLQIPSEKIHHAVYAPGGHLVFQRGVNPGSLWAVRFSLSSLRTEGEPFLLESGVGAPSVAADGTLLYGIGAGALYRQLALVDMEGKLVRKVGEPQRGVHYPEISWDGKRVAVAALGADETPALWVHDIERGSAIKLTFGELGAGESTWAPSDDRLFFSAFEGIHAVAADGTGEPELIIEDGFGPSMQPGVPWIGYAVNDEKTKNDLVYRGLADGSEPTALLVAEEHQFDIQIAPGGEYAVYGSLETGREEAYLTRFPTGKGKWRVSLGGGFWPRWGPTGKRIYFLMRDRDRGNISLMKVDVTLADAPDEPKLSAPQKLFGDDTVPGLRLSFDGDRDFAIHPDGERILVLFAEDSDDVETPRLVLVQNWLDMFGNERRRQAIPK